MQGVITRKWRTLRLNWLRDRIITNGQILNGFRRDRAALSTALLPEEASRLDALINKYEWRHASLLSRFKEAQETNVR